MFSPGRERRIILATNVAETSVTIPRIRFVIDSGLARIKRFNPRSQIEELQIETISQASARQRRGRCGRIADGVCVHLYSEDDLARASAYTDPEIKRTGLAGVILQMASLRLPRIDRFPFINPPPPAAVREGLRTLEDLRALDPAGHLTREGWKLAALPIDPHLGRIRYQRQFSAFERVVLLRDRPARAQCQQRQQRQNDSFHTYFLFEFVTRKYAFRTTFRSVPKKLLTAAVRNGASPHFPLSLRLRTKRPVFLPPYFFIRRIFRIFGDPFGVM